MSARRAPAFRLRRAAAAAQLLLDRYGVCIPADLRLEDLAWAEGAEVRYGRLDGSAARLVVRATGGRAVIRIAEQTGDGGHARFSIAHELGHLLLHRDALVELCTDGDLAIETNRPLEGEANAFATELLLPQRFVAPYVRDGLSMDAVRELSVVLDVSLTAALLRVATFTATPVAVALTGENRVVRWTWSNDAFPWYTRERGLPAHGDSLAARVLRGLTRQDEDTVPADAWVSDDDLEEDVELVEQIVRMPRWGTVMSILVIAS